MFSWIIHKILQINRAYGIEISLMANNELVIQAVTLQLEKNRVVKKNETHSMTSVRDLQKIIPSGSPVAVTINGKGILHKKVVKEDQAANLFEAVLPNANPADFYLENCAYESFYSVYIIRRTVLDKIIDELILNKMRVLSISIGTADLEFLLPYINFAREQEGLKSNHFLMRFDAAKKVTDIESLPFPVEEARPTLEYNIGNQYVFSRAIMAFASAMKLFSAAILDKADVSSTVIKKEKEEYRYYKYYRFSLWAFLSGLFGILLISYLLYDHYARLNEEQSATFILTQGQLVRDERQEAAILTKEKFIGQYGWDHPGRISLYADRIAALVPDDAQLTSLKINPINTGFFSDDNILSFQRGTIQITGTCEDPSELNRFVNNLRNVRDFHEINIKNYLYKKETKNGTFLMEIITF